MLSLVMKFYEDIQNMSPAQEWAWNHTEETLYIQDGGRAIRAKGE